MDVPVSTDPGGMGLGRSVLLVRQHGRFLLQNTLAKAARRLQILLCLQVVFDLSMAREAEDYCGLLLGVSQLGPNWGPTGSQLMGPNSKRVKLSPKRRVVLVTLLKEYISILFIY
jgi:hypothetical protein